MPGSARIARLVLFASLSLPQAPALEAIDISLQGDWSTTLGALDLEAGAGSELTGVHQSDTDHAVISIAGATGPWRVDARKSDLTWDSALQLAVRRTSDGTGSGSISGGTSYLDVSAFDATLFSGDADRDGVDLQIRLSGVSAALGASSFSTTLTYTVVDE